MIEFLCPNGHRIRCQADHAGRAARCARCGVRFRVPDARELHGPDAIGPDSNVSRAEFTDSGIGSGPSHSLARPQKETQVEFLCPNGHRLFGPSSLQGRAGECPECGSRFLIPTYDAAQSEEMQLRRIEVREGAGNVASAVAESRSTASSSLSRAAPRQASAPQRDVAASETATVFARLWAARPAESTIEVQLRDGETIRPDQFLEKLSQESHRAVFAVKESDDSLRLVAIGWDAVAQVSMRGIHELPKELAE